MRTARSKDKASYERAKLCIQLILLTILVGLSIAPREKFLCVTSRYILACRCEGLVSFNAGLRHISCG